MNTITKEKALCVEHEPVWVMGSAASGKTGFLIRKVQALVKCGVPAGGICVMAGTAEACRTLRMCLVQTNDALAQVRVATPIDMFVEMLDTPLVRHAMGRIPRVLTRVERVILQNDMKENTPYDSVVDCLRVRQGMLAEELPHLAVQYLESREGSALQDSYEAVLVDDAHTMDAKVLQVAALLSKRCITAAGNEQGLVTFSQVFPQAVCVVLEQPSYETPAAQALRKPKRVESIKWRTPEDEFKGVAALVRECLHTFDDLNQADIYVAVPNRVWVNHVCKALAARRLSSAVVMDGDALRGNPQDTASCHLLEAYALLALIANRNDVLAWRLWCACGSKTCRTVQWCALEQQAVRAGKSLSQVILSVGENPACSDELAQRIASALAIMRRASQLKGHSLLKSVSGDADSAALADLAGYVMGDESAEELFARIARRVQDPVFPEDFRRVRVGTLAHMRGLNPRVLIVAGAVDGFLPARNADAERDLFCNAVAKASEYVVLSSVQKIDAAQAEKLHMKPRRFKMENGVKMAMLARSPFIDEAGDAAPGTVSGEQRLN